MGVSPFDLCNKMLDLIQYYFHARQYYNSTFSKTSFCMPTKYLKPASSLDWNKLKQIWVHSNFSLTLAPLHPTLEWLYTCQTLGIWPLALHGIVALDFLCLTIKSHDIFPKLCEISGLNTYICLIGNLCRVGTCGLIIINMDWPNYIASSVGSSGEITL